jgi:hypothetical protein
MRLLFELSSMSESSGDMSVNPMKAHNSDATWQWDSVRYVDLREISEPNKRVFSSLRMLVGGAVVNEAAIPVIYSLASDATVNHKSLHPA